jgi:SAM-dependent methyltransferase
MTDGPAPAGDEVRQLFDVKAATWSAKYAPHEPLAARLACLSEAVGRYVRPGDRVLDLGCGTGELARALAGSGLGVAGCDISPEMLRRAARDSGRCVGGLGATGARVAHHALRVGSIRRGDRGQRARIRGRAGRRAA